MPAVNTVVQLGSQVDGMGAYFDFPYGHHASSPGQIGGDYAERGQTRVTFSVQVSPTTADDHFRYGASSRCFRLLIATTEPPGDGRQRRNVHDRGEQPARL